MAPQPAQVQSLEQETQQAIQMKKFAIKYLQFTGYVTAVFAATAVLLTIAGRVIMFGVMIVAGGYELIKPKPTQAPLVRRGNQSRATRALDASHQSVLG
jgi:hypothetical protein